MGATLGDTDDGGAIAHGFWGATTANFAINEWYHVAMSRESDGWHYIWVNGTKYGWGTGIRDDSDSLGPLIKCNFIDHIIVSTDSKKYATISKKFGAEIPFIRKKISKR